MSASETKRGDLRVKIRCARAQDAKEVAKLLREEMEISVSAADIAHALTRLCVNPRHRVFVAEAEGEVVGVAHLCDCDSPLFSKPMALLTVIAVKKTHRRAGIGSALLARARKLAAESGAGGILLASHEMQTGAHAFFKACGFTSRRRALEMSIDFEETENGGNEP